ncbi:Maf-like protein YhdE [Rubripirellula lacrimiformis]|uniref:dTTP/UTP pyrophosphatase n=1 Tax=Rubripirellula lacrimiformis TaxID=1930273 RepID=A0A517NFT6_9BACT|nr:nucleoside triphosphate pyrophosphatase [Rubripirellula lacrimiformis]QDT06002.1 Maf-like protein YhdE [Rubripirellula lacrimiformis]
MTDSNDLPLMQNLPCARLPTDEPIVLGSGSPRRAQLMTAAGYPFTVQVASDEAECGMCSRETAPEMVARYAYRKAAEIATRMTADKDTGLIIAADTVASCVGQILGKPRDQEHAESTLRLLSGRRHDVYTGVCVWSVKHGKCVVDVVRTELMMKPISEPMLADYLDTMLWEGKAGAFGYQDGNDWLSIIGDGSESNVVGLPMERLAELLENFDSLAETVITGSTEPLGQSRRNC